MSQRYRITLIYEVEDAKIAAQHLDGTTTTNLIFINISEISEEKGNTE